VAIRDLHKRDILDVERRRGGADADIADDSRSWACVVPPFLYSH
jgi:hypothetical protein